MSKKMILKKTDLEIPGHIETNEKVDICKPELKHRGKKLANLQNGINLSSD